MAQIASFSNITKFALNAWQFKGIYWPIVAANFSALEALVELSVTIDPRSHKARKDGFFLGPVDYSEEGPTEEDPEVRLIPASPVRMWRAKANREIAKAT